MHLWGKMATQHSQSNQLHTSQTSHLSGLAGTMRPHYFSASSKSSSSSQTPLYGGSTSLSALLSGKHAAASSYPSPPTSPVAPIKVLANSSSREKDQQREKEHQHAMLAVMASQTIFKKLGSAFWDAFTGGSSSSSGLNSAGSQQAMWDVDKVKKVLEGKAVLKVVDIEPAPSSGVSLAKVAMRERTMAPSSPVQDEWKKCSSTVCDLLEESMRSLTLGKKM